MSDGCFKGTPRKELERQVMDSNDPKNEREWWARGEIERLRAELAAERERIAAATHYATQIAVWTVDTFFEPDKTGWKPLTELLGVLSQLDNALVGVREKRDAEREKVAKLREALTSLIIYTGDDTDKDDPFAPSDWNELTRRARAILKETGDGK